jgi:ParB family transcriptional regulator, chromosome partitioning protein
MDPPPPSNIPRSAILTVGIEELHPNRTQPRKTFDDAALDELAGSIQAHGLIQPIVVRSHKEGFEIIAGERRWRACQRAALRTVQVVVKDLADDDAFEWALVENIQREDLNPIEEAEAYKRLLDLRDLTQEQLADRVNKDRSTVANALRLLKLPDEVRRQVIAGAISMGHARALLGLETSEDMIKMGREVVKRGLSVRDVERAVKAEKHAKAASGSAVRDPFQFIPGGAAAAGRVADDLTKRFGTRVRIVPEGRRGRVEVEYNSTDELERLISIMKG